MRNLEGHLWVRADRGRAKRYYHRALMPIFENGVRSYRDVRRSLGTSLEAAQREARRLDAEAEAQARGEEVRREATLGEFAEWYVRHVRDERKLLGWKTVAVNARQFLRQIGNRPLRRITRYDVEAYLAVRKQTVRPTTVRSNLRDVKRMLAVAVERGYLEASPAAAIKLGFAKPLPVRLPTVEEVARLIAYLKRKEPDLYPLAIMLIGTGCRLGEALALDWADVDLARGVLVLRRRKVQDALAMRLVGPLRDVLWGLWTDRQMPRQGPVFTGCKGGPLSRHTTRSAFRRAAGALGVPWLTLKTFRKLAATHVAESTGDARVAQMLLGHTSLQTTELYLGRGDRARERGIGVMAEFLGEVAGRPGGVGTGVGSAGSPPAAGDDSGKANR